MDLFDTAVVAATYRKYRYQYFGVLDSIRFTANELGMKAIDVASALGLSSYFMEHR